MGMVVQTDWHAAYQSWKVRPRDSRPYAVPGLPRPSGLLQFRPLQSQHDHECRPSARSYPHQVIRRWLCVYAVRPSRCGRGAEFGHPCRAAFVLIIRAPACPSRLTSRRSLTGLLKPFGVRFTRPNTCRGRGLPERGCSALWARCPRKMRGIYAKRRKHSDATAYCSDCPPAR